MLNEKQNSSVKRSNGRWIGIGVKFKEIYLAFSVMLLNLIVLFFLLEIIFRVFMPEREEIDPFNPVIAAREIVKKYEAEFKIADERERYYPYAVWKRFPYKGETINVDENGVRKTPGAHCSAGSYKVFVFGGSTIWGMAAPDWQTIPAFLQARLSEFLGRPVCVRNFGEIGYVARQSLAFLLNQIHANNIPDFVIFYDGFNEVFSAYENGASGKHYGFFSIARKFESNRGESLLDFLSDLAFPRALRRIIPGEEDEEEEIEKGERKTEVEREASSENTLVKSIADHYLTTYAAVEAISEKWDFKFVFFVQPVIVLGNKPLTEEEKRIRELYDLDSSGLEMMVNTYKILIQEAPAKERMVLIHDVFDNVETDIWYDEVHVSGEGNKIVAERMFETIKHQIEPQANK